MIYEGVGEIFSYRDDRTSQIVSAFVVGDSDDEAKVKSTRNTSFCAWSRLWRGGLLDEPVEDFVNDVFEVIL
jgi:hypothetical protein